MATLDSRCRTAGSVTLVEVCVTADRDRQVRVENCLDGPVWPPRTGGVPETGWDEEGFEGRVVPDTPLVLGYASPADPRDPPARIADESEPTDAGLTAREVVRELGTAGPPRDAMPGSEAETGTDGAGRSEATADGASDAAPEDRDGPFGDWFGSVEERLAAAERLEAVSSVEQAQSVVESMGGMPAVRALRAQLQRDRDRLTRLDRQCSRAREWADEVEVPVEALERVA